MTTKYCITCDWTGIKTPPNYFFVTGGNDLHGYLSWLEMGRSATQSHPLNIEVFKLVEQLEVDLIRQQAERPHNM